MKKKIVLLILVGIVTYFTSLSNGFVWDDSHFVIENFLVTKLNWENVVTIFNSNTTAGAGTSSNYFRPLTTLSFAIDYRLWGKNAVGFHLNNTVIHISNGILLYLLFIYLGLGNLSLFLSLIFLVHPIQTEAVTYISSRGDGLYTLFHLISVYLFVLTITKKRNKNLWLFISVICVPLSILSKEGSLTVLPVYLGILFREKIIRKLSFGDFHEKYKSHISAFLFMVFISLIYFLLRLTILNFNDSLNYSGAYDLYTKNPVVRFYTFLKVFLIDLSLLAFPDPLYLERSTEIVTNFFSPYVIGALVIIGFLIFSGLQEWKKSKTVWIFMGMLLFFSHILSVSGIIPMTGLVRENWLYVPMVGVYLVFFSLIRLFFPFILKQKYRKIINFGGVLLIIIYMIWTTIHNRVWFDNITFYKHNLKYANTARLHLNLGNTYLGKGMYDESLVELNEAIKIADVYPEPHYNLAFIYDKQGKKDLAEKEYLKSLQINPEYLFTYPLLINLYLETDRPKLALPYIKRLLLIYPNDPTIMKLMEKVNNEKLLQ